ncbi:MAG: glycosyltransferase family 39 protein [Elusimicrobiota bacterium]
MYKKLPYFLVPLLILIFYLRIFSTIKIKSDTYDELKCLKAGEYLSKGAGWVVEASVFHPPLSYYIHGYLLKNRFFKNTDEQIFYARLIMAVFAALFGFFVFKYAEEKFGTPSGLVALFLFTFCPNIIAFSCFVVPDILVAFFIFLGFYTYEKSLEKTKDFFGKKSVFAGLIFGFALLSKYTGIFLVPIYILLGLKKIIFEKLEIKHFVKQFFVVCAVGLFVLNLGYKFTGSFKPLTDFSFESKFFSKLSEIPVLSEIPLPVPAPFVYGFDIQKHISEAGHPTFLRGVRSIKGWWYYFIVAFLIKVPIPFLILLLVAIFYKPKEKINLAVAILILTLPFVLFTNSNPGLRYLIPIFPFLFIYVSDLINIRKKVFTVGLWFLLGWFAVESILIHPHYIAYFNQLIGGPKNGYKYLADSNIDWGQDRFLVLKYLKKNPEVKLNPVEPTVGKILINVNNLQDVFSIEEKHRWLKNFEPVGNIGYSWLLYDIKLDDYKKLSKKIPGDYYFNYLLGFLTGDKKFLEKSIELNPGFTDARLKLGQLLSSENKNEQAILEYKKILEENPNNYLSYKYLSEEYKKTGNNLPSPFSRAFQKGRGLAAEYERRYKVAKILSSYIVVISTAENYYKNEVEKNPKDAKFINNLGFIFWMKGDLDKAIFYFEKAVQLRPNFIDYLGNLAAVHREKGDRKKYYKLRNEYYQRYNLISSARVSQIQYGDDKMILEDVFILPVDE